MRKCLSIVTLVFKRKSPKGKRIWNEYKKLKNIRDRIIHLKTKDRKSSGPKDDTIWKYLLNKELPNMSEVAKHLIDYFAANLDKKPRWYRNYPL